MVDIRNMWGFGRQATLSIFRYANLDRKLLRQMISAHRQHRMLKALMTTPFGSDDEYFDDVPASSIRVAPLTLLEDVDNGDQSLLDVVISYLVKVPWLEPLSPFESSSEISEHDDQNCHVAKHVLQRDYTYEHCWCKYSYRGRPWLYNSETEEWFWVDDAGAWVQYRYMHARSWYTWWLRGRRFFIEPS